MAMVAHVFEAGTVRRLEDFASIEAALAQKKAAIWIDAFGEDADVRRLLEQTCGLHPLLVEDVLQERQLPKVEDFGEYLYIVMHGVHREAEGPTDLCTVEIDVLVGATWIFTHHDTALRSVEEVTVELQRNPRLLERGPAFVAHAIIDRMTDHYLPVVDRFEEEIDSIEEAITTRPDPSLLQQLFGMKRSLQRLRRISTYQRDLLQRLSRHEFAHIPEPALPFFRDVFDHFVRIADLADSYREMVTVSLEIYMSVMANRTNEVMKALALISTVMLPLNLLAGLYGMNFAWMPMLAWRNGFWIMCGAMMVTALVLWGTFRRRKWL